MLLQSYTWVDEIFGLGLVSFLISFFSISDFLNNMDSFCSYNLVLISQHNQQQIFGINKKAIVLRALLQCYQVICAWKCLFERDFLQKEFLVCPKLCFCTLLIYVFTQQYTWPEIKFWQGFISCQVYRWCILVKTYINKIQKHNFGRTKISFYRNLSSNKLIFGTNELRALQQSVQQNCFFVHRKILLLAMLGNESKTVRAKADHIIQKIIQSKKGNQGQERDPVREFHLPICNFGATSYTDPIIPKDYGRGNGVSYLTHKKGYLVLPETPLIKSHTDLNQFAKQPLHLNYTQSVVYAVKMTPAGSGWSAGA